MKTPKFSDILPEYPSITYLPWKPKGNNIAIDYLDIFSSNVYIQEKVDGGNCGMSLFEGHPIIRSKTKFLRKGIRKDDNPSLAQFASVFDWFYKNKDKFVYLNKKLGNVSVYGDWMIQRHGLEYDELPDWFIAYDIYDFDKKRFLDPKKAIENLKAAGF